MFEKFLHTKYIGQKRFSLEGGETTIAALDEIINTAADNQSGLVDFLAKIDGRDVYLCWRYGEPRVAHYHELHTGYNGRQPV